MRLRANRQTAADADSFRAHLKQLLATADDQARRSGYDQGTVKRAIYAVTVFLDESVLNSSQPMFADWPRKPLQEEIFGGHMGGFGGGHVGHFGGAPVRKLWGHYE